MVGKIQSKHLGSHMRTLISIVSVYQNGRLHMLSAHRVYVLWYSVMYCNTVVQLATDCCIFIIESSLIPYTGTTIRTCEANDDDGK